MHGTFVDFISHPSVDLAGPTLTVCAWTLTAENLPP
jgi:hypothetical protein